MIQHVTFSVGNYSHQKIKVYQGEILEESPRSWQYCPTVNLVLYSISTLFSENVIKIVWDLNY